jgi:hypothetical protein
MGLPVYFYEQVINLLKKISNEYDSNKYLNCADDGSNSTCLLNGKCTDYKELWTYSFNITFEPSQTEYIVIPLASFAN